MKYIHGILSWPENADKESADDGYAYLLNQKTSMCYLYYKLVYFFAWKYCFGMNVR